ncbi:MAG: hypothetical protein NDI88_00585 [Lysobacter sp.]|nr:hypothetical protein [Lysobacter sp.]
MNADAPPMNADKFDTERSAMLDSTAFAKCRRMIPTLPYRRSSAGHRRSSAFPQIFARITRGS